MDTPFDPIQRMAGQLSRLPGVGHKSAQRLAYFLARRPQSEVDELANALIEGRRAIMLCSRCGNYTPTDPCPICANPKREQGLLCVVRDPRDVNAIERMREFRGVYHVLHGTLSPMDGVGPSDLRIRELMERLGKEPIAEVILATNPDIEGEATASYLARLIKPMEILVTRIARGLPVGGDLEYVDQTTLGKAFEGRSPL